MKIHILVLATIVSLALGITIRDTKALGAFQRTCNSVTLKASTLTAKCQAMNGSWRDTSVDLNRCLANMNGNLQWAVNGNYIASSRGCALRLPNLICNSQRANQSWNSSASINIDAGITNRDGRLVCDNAASSPSPPTPSPPTPRPPTPSPPTPTPPTPTPPTPTPVIPRPDQIPVPPNREGNTSPSPAPGPSKKCSPVGLEAIKKQNEPKKSLK